jgi:hypothetical protein
VPDSGRGQCLPGVTRGREQGDGEPPLAESPATAIDLAVRFWSVRSQRYAARTSSIAAGEGMLGSQPIFREQHPHPAGRSQPGGQLARRSVALISLTM